MKRTAWIIGLLLLPSLGYGLPAGARVVLWDLTSLAVAEIETPLAEWADLPGVEGAVALDLDGISGDELLLLHHGSRVVVLDLISGAAVLDSPLADLAAVWGLAGEAGAWCSLDPPGRSGGDLLLHRDPVAGWHELDLGSGAAGLYNGPDLPGGFVSGAGGQHQGDPLLLWREPGESSWFHRAWPDGPDAAIDWTLVLGFEPRGLTELRLGGSRYLIACSPGTPEPTPTPTETPLPSPTPSPAGTPHPWEALVANSLGETLSAVSRSEPRQIWNDLAETGFSPSEITIQGDRVFVVNSLSHSVGIYRLDDLTLLDEIRIEGSTNPISLELVEGDRAFVSCLLSDELAVVDLAAGVVTARIPLPVAEFPRDDGVDRTWGRPGGLARSGDHLFVACANLDSSFVAGGPGVVVEVDPATEQVVRWFESGGRNTLDLAPHPWEPDRLLMANAGDHEPGQGFLGNGSVTVYSTTSQSLVDAYPTGEAPFELALGPSGRLYLGNGMTGRVLRIDLAGGGVLPPLDLPDTGGPGLSYASGLAVGADGILWVLEFNSDRLYRFDTAQGDLLLGDPLITGDGPDALALIPGDQT